MKKLLVALPFVATASWAGTTLYSGNQTRAAYDDLIAQLDMAVAPATGLEISTESYTAGFTASRAVTWVRASGDADAPVLFRLRHDISHSPIGLDDGAARVGAARIVTTLLTEDLDETARHFVDELFAGETPVVLESDVGFDRQVSNVLSVAPAALNEDGVLFELGAIRYDIGMDAQGGLSGTGAFAGGRLALADTGLAVTLSPGTDRFAFERVGAGVYTGEQHADFGTLSLENPMMGLDATLADITYDADSSLDADRFASGATFAVGRIESPLPLESLSLGARVGGLDVAGLEELIRVVGELQTPVLDAMGTDSDVPAALLERIVSAYANLVAPGLSIDYDIAMSNAGGDVTASAGVLFEGDGSASGHDSMTTVGDLVRALTLSATLEADADAVAMTPAAMFLAGDRLAPWIVSNGVGYTSALGVDDLILDVNGNAMSLEDMLGGMLELPLDFSMLTSMAGR